jgi:hypothetical protein
MTMSNKLLSEIVSGVCFTSSTITQSCKGLFLCVCLQRRKVQNCRFLVGKACKNLAWKNVITASSILKPFVQWIRTPDLTDVCNTGNENAKPISRTAEECGLKSSLSFAINFTTSCAMKSNSSYISLHCTQLSCHQNSQAPTKEFLCYIFSWMKLWSNNAFESLVMLLLLLQL